MRRYGLRDDQWDRIKDLLPGREGSVGVTRTRQPPLRPGGSLSLPCWHSVARSARAVRGPDQAAYAVLRWARSGVWERLFAHLAADADNEYAMIDSTIVRAHQHSAGTQKD